jgi:hypothetical protein
MAPMRNGALMRGFESSGLTDTSAARDGNARTSTNHGAHTMRDITPRHASSSRGCVVAATFCETDGERVRAMFRVMNPEKLTHVA